MTWWWRVDDAGDLAVWDHTQDPTTDPPFETLTDDNGWQWPTGEFPDDVLDVMHDEARAALQNQNVERAVTITLDMAGEQIEQA